MKPTIVAGDTIRTRRIGTVASRVRLGWNLAKLKAFGGAPWLSNVVAFIALAISVHSCNDSNSVREEARVQQEKDNRLTVNRLVMDASKALEVTSPLPQPIGENIRIETQAVTLQRIEAENELRSALEYDPNFGPAHRALAESHLQKGQYEAAVAELGLAIKLSPSDARAHALLGNAHLSAHKFKESTLAYHQCLDIDQNNVVALNGLGSVDRLNGRYRASREWIERALEADPQDARSQCNLGYTLLVDQDREGAERAFRRCATLNPSGQPSRSALEAWLSLGALLAEGGDFQGAEEAYRRALIARPEDPIAMYDLARTLARAEQYSSGEASASKLAEAERLFRDCLNKAPGSYTLNRSFGLFYIMREREEEGLQYLRVAARLAPNDRELAYAIVTIETKLAKSRRK
jgi:tetratricopeptide (TPR) repeat protein